MWRSRRNLVRVPESAKWCVHGHVPASTYPLSSDSKDFEWYGTVFAPAGLQNCNISIRFYHRSGNPITPNGHAESFFRSVYRLNPTSNYPLRPDSKEFGRECTIFSQTGLEICDILVLGFGRSELELRLGDGRFRSVRNPLPRVVLELQIISVIQQTIP